MFRNGLAAPSLGLASAGFALFAPVAVMGAMPRDVARLAALQSANHRGDHERLRSLLDAGIDPNVDNHLGMTALMWAARYGDIECARLLLERGADPSRRDNYGRTALTFAIEGKSREVETLLSQRE
jgi:ankyrin repeat protein